MKYKPHLVLFFCRYLDELLEEAEEEYKSDLEEYQEKLKKWNKLKQKKVFMGKLWNLIN